jgi:Rrf2 family protein
MSRLAPRSDLSGCAGIAPARWAGARILRQVTGPVARWWLNACVQISAKVDYALRALVTLAAMEPAACTAEELANAQGLPVRFLRTILDDLRRGQMVTSQRGAEGGYRLARGAKEITVGEVIRRLDGPLAEIRGSRPEATTYGGAAETLQDVWVAVRAVLRGVLDSVTIDQVASGKLPPHVVELAAHPEAWEPR